MKKDGVEYWIRLILMSFGTAVLFALWKHDPFFYVFYGLNVVGAFTGVWCYFVFNTMAAFSRKTD